MLLAAAVLSYKLRSAVWEVAHIASATEEPPGVGGATAGDASPPTRRPASSHATHAPFAAPAGDRRREDGGGRGGDGDGEKPLLLLHVGPHKTATSAIQCHLSHHRRLLLETASFAYVGRLYGACLGAGDRKSRDPFDPRDIVRCLDRHGREDRPCGEGSDIWRRIDGELRDQARRGNNVIISDEAFSRLRTAATEGNGRGDGENQTGAHEAKIRPYRLLHELLARHHRVRVVVGYRRYHEWVTSSYHHLVGRTLERGEWPASYLYRHGLERGFSDAYRYFRELHPTEYLAGRYGAAFDDVVVFDLHDRDSGDHLMERFFRQARLLPPSRNETTGRALGTVLAAMRDYEPDNSNTGWPWAAMNVMTLAMAAQRWDLVGSGGAAAEEGGGEGKEAEKRETDENRRNERKEARRRVRIARAIAKEVRTSNLTLPLDCLAPQEEEAFLNRSLAFERRLFGADGDGRAPRTAVPASGDRGDDGGVGRRRHRRRFGDRVMKEREAEHRAKFAAARHCSVDIDRVRNETEWLQFFKSL